MLFFGLNLFPAIRPSPFIFFLVFCCLIQKSARYLVIAVKKDIINAFEVNQGYTRGRAKKLYGYSGF